MKFAERLILVIAVTAVFTLAGCATKREVVGNQFISDFPKMDITFSPEFKYTGRAQTFADGVDFLRTNPTHTGRFKTEYYHWNDSERKKGSPDRAVMLTISQFTEPNWGWKAPILQQNGQHILQYELLTFEGIHYERQLKLARIKGRAKCVLMESISNVSYLDTAIIVSYWESIKKSGFSCEEWRAKDKYSDHQKAYLDGFLKRADKVYSPKPAFLSYSQKKADVPEAKPAPLQQDKKTTAE